ncbi:MAG TPA: hypothetical protein VGE43_17210, partial [Acidimicrobiales bacterium]
PDGPDTELAAAIPGWEGTVGPGPGQYGRPHVYARDVTSGSGNCVCGRDDTHGLHVPVPASPRGGATGYPATSGASFGAATIAMLADKLGQIAEMVGLPRDAEDDDDVVVAAVRRALARPAAGRDLTGDDVRTAFERWEKSGDGFGEHAGSYVAGLLNGIARPAVARTDGQCTCGDPSAADLVHHTEAPCRTVEELRTGRTDGQPHPDPRGRYDVPDPYDHPGWPLVSRIVAIATDTAPTMPNETDGVDNAVTGLLADQSWRDHVAMADVMGLVGDWGTDDVVQAVTDALHEYPRLRALVARTDGQPPADERPAPSPDPCGDGLCPNCPTDLATLDSGHGVCIECGWTSDPGKCMELYDRIDELVAVARSVVDLVDGTVGMPGVVRDVVDNLRDALSAAPADDTAGQGWGDVESADFIERARAATAGGSFTAQFDHVYDPSGDLVCDSVDHSTAVRIAAALSGAPADDTAAPDGLTTGVRVEEGDGGTWGWECTRCNYRSVAWWSDRGVAERAAAEHERDRCPAAGQPVRDSQGRES